MEAYLDNSATTRCSKAAADMAVSYTHLDVYKRQPLDNETILKLNILLNTSLNGLAMTEINLGNIASIKERAGIHSGIVLSLIHI